jgi:hypothetical protein
MKCHASEKITPSDLVSLFNKTYSRVSSLEKAAKGLEKSGIWPLNPETYGEEDFMVASNLQRISEHEEEPTAVIPIPTDDLFGSSSISGTSQIQDMDSMTENSPTRDFNSSSKRVLVPTADIFPIPGPTNVPMNRPKRHMSKKLKSEILTATPMKEKLEAERRRSNKCSKKNVPKTGQKTKNDRQNNREGFV